MKSKFLFFLMVMSSLALSINLTPGAASSSQTPSKVSGSCPQTIFVNTGQSIGNENSLSVALGDLNGDDIADAVVGNAAGSGVWEEVWLNQGGTTFTFGQTFGENGDTPGVVLVDAEGDDDLDIIPAGSGSILFKNDGNGVFTMGQWLNFGYNNAIAVGELVNGGLFEVVLAGNGSTTPAQVWFNTGDLFNPYSVGFTFTVSSAVDILVGNVDGDLDDDVVIVNRNNLGNESSQVWLNNNDGTFTAGDAIQPTLPQVSASALGDVDGDNDLDLVIGFDGFGTTIEVWHNNGNGFFTPGMPILSPMLVSDLALFDLDGDLDEDIVASELSGTAQAWLNNGTGIFCQAQTGIGTSVNGLALRDLDGDDMPDLFTAENGGNQLWLNTLAASEGVDLRIIWEGASPTIDETYEIYTVTITNLGDLAATDILLTLTKFPNPDGYSSGGWHSIIPNPGPCSSITCTLPSLLPGQSVEFFPAFTFYLDDDEDDFFDSPVVFNFEISVNPGEPDANPWNNTIFPSVYVYTCSCTATRFWDLCRPFIFLHNGLNAVQTTVQSEIDLLLLYRVRNEILATSPTGQHIIDLYYSNDAELQTLIINDQALFNEALNTILLWQPNLQALVDGQGDTAIITQAQVDAVDDILNQLSAVASPALQADIAIERAKLPNPDDFVGMSMTEARGVVVGFAIFLPTVLNQR